MTTTTMDPNEITRVIDGVYKNILENFNPASRQMIATGKAYLKSLQGASAACSLYLEALGKLSRQAQQSSIGCAGDIGSSLMQATEVFKEIHTQQLSTLKAFYVDFLVPLETNLEKDTRVIQNEQKKFLMCHKQRIEGFSKAASSAKKVRKKSRKSNSSSALDKEIKVIQNLEDERTKLETFCENSLKDALTQERRRYGFILERKTSLAKHYLAFYSKGNTLLNHKLENWLKVAKSREALPEAMQTSLLKRIQGEEDCIYCNPPRPADDTVSISSQLRKTKSMDASEILNVTSQQDVPLNSSSTGTLTRAKSDANLGMGMTNGGIGINEPMQQCHPFQSLPASSNEEIQVQSSGAVRPKSLAVSAETTTQGFARALYAYLSSGENQLCFLEGDTIGLIGENNKGWQFGENLRTNKTGWFPVAYTEFDPSCEQGLGAMLSSGSQIPPPILMPPPPAAICSTFQQKRLNLADVMVHRTPEQHQHQHQHQNMMNMNKGGLKSPKTPTTPNILSTSTQTPTTPTTSLLLANGGSRSASDSLHSSNDSGFSNDLGHASQQKPVPPQPNPDYSDDEPQLSNSEDLSSGDKWLMDRYQKSECARLGEAVVVGKGPRRSLSFGNISGSGDLDEVDRKMMKSKNAGEKLHRSQRDRSRPPVTHQNSFHATNNENNGGALQKFLTRTKSLIWKGGKNGNGNGRNERNERNAHRRSEQTGFDSISNAGSFQDLWGSHQSICGAGKRGNSKKQNESIYEMKPMTRKSEREQSNGRHNANAPTAAAAGAPSPDPKMQHIPLPPPPPPPPNAQKHHHYHHQEELPIPPPQRRIQNKSVPIPDQSAPSPNSSLENDREREHQRRHHNQQHQQRGSSTPAARKAPEPELDLSTEESVTNLNHRNNQQPEQPAARPRKSQRVVTRVESFSGSEAPIIPTQRNNFKNRVGSGRRHGHSGRAARNGNSNNGFGRSASYAHGHGGKKPPHSRYIIASKAPASLENSDDNFEDEDDFSTANDGENDYDDGASSVCYVVETPIPEHHKSNGLRSQSGSRNSFRRSHNGNNGHHGLKSQSMRVTPSHGKSNSGVGRSMVVTPGYGHPRNTNNITTATASPSPSITKMSTTVEKSVNVRGGNGKRPTRIKGSIHSEFHTVELIASDEDVNGSGNSGELVVKQGKDKQPIFDYGSHIHRRLYYPERSSRMDQKSERGATENDTSLRINTQRSE